MRDDQKPTPDYDEEQLTYIRQQEPPTKPPPLLETGVLAWIRINLFSSVLNSFLTIVTFVVVFFAITSSIVWAIEDANWFAIIFNFRQFMVGRFEQEFEWRAIVTVLGVSFVIGMAVAVWIKQLARTALGVILAVLFVFLLFPPIIINAIPLAPSYLAASNTEIVSGSATETALPQVVFIARAGETVSLRFAPGIVGRDEEVAALSGFVDFATNTLRNAARNRLQEIERREFLENTLQAHRNSDIPILTAGQAAAFEAELEALTIVDPIVEQYHLNQVPTTVNILHGETLEPIAASVTLDSLDDSARFVLPEDGWYVLEKTIADDTISAAVILAADGIYPYLQSVIATPQEQKERTTAAFLDTFSRVTDGYRILDSPPDVEGDVNIIRNQYRGSRNLADYLRIYIVPFLTNNQQGFSLVLILGVMGYLTLMLIERIANKKIATRTATYSLIATPVFIWIFINGIGIAPFAFSDARDWGGFLLTMMLTIYGIIAAFPIGVALALGRRSDLPAIKYFCTAYIELVRGVPFITVLFFMQLLIPLINSDLAALSNSYRALVAVIMFSAAYLAENVRGGLQSIPHGQTEAGRALGLSTWQITRLITLPQALRAVIPALVGQFISLFKDTSLVAIVGLIDLTGFVNTMVVQTEFSGTRLEGLLFISIIYFVFSYVMSYVSRLLEASGSGSTRRM